jgi:hypothetical protein
MRILNAFLSTLSPSWKSMARLVFPPRLELKSPAGSLNAAPLGEGQLHDGLVRLARADHPIVVPGRDASPLPLLDDSGAASLTSARSRPSISPVIEFVDPLVDQLRGSLAPG